ncbi:MAG: acyl-ACP--UDP-N-acetylglucosamine O-acyltransferase [Planctomycetes bacterium]|nr:acyl-ACP--UDP-N-acetylglucosamine O-acyltransferase [Planctomycetota bacterium]
MSIHPTAIVDRQAELDSTVVVGPHCIIEAHVRVAAGCTLYQNVYLTGWTEIAQACVLHPNVIVGHEPQDTKYSGERSYCRIGRETILRENTTIHRGTVPESETTVGQRCYLMAGSHVAHNGKVGNDVTMGNNVMLAGHVEIEDGVILGGGAGVHQFVRIGALAMVPGNASLAKDVVPFAMIDFEGRVAGLNQVGLRRAGVPPEHILELRKAFRTLFGRHAAFRDAIDRVARVGGCPPLDQLVRFLRQESRRGIAGRVRRRGESPLAQQDSGNMEREPPAC